MAETPVGIPIMKHSSAISSAVQMSFIFIFHYFPSLTGFLLRPHLVSFTVHRKFLSPNEGWWRI